MFNLATPILTSEWVTPQYISFHYGRSRRLVEIWCNDGTLIDFGFSVYQDSSRRWWIKCSQPALSPV